LSCSLPDQECLEFKYDRVSHLVHEQQIHLPADVGAHLNTDVLTGRVIGAACGILVPELHRFKNKDKNFSFKPFYKLGSGGVTLSYTIQQAIHYPLQSEDSTYLHIWINSAGSG
jgi:hypothetical protein